MYQNKSLLMIFEEAGDQEINTIILIITSKHNSIIQTLIEDLSINNSIIINPAMETIITKIDNHNHTIRTFRA